MKAITVQQPWAWAIASGHKTVENRTWSTSYRGPLAIHAGQTWDKPGARAMAQLVDKLFAIPEEYRVGRGVVVAVAELVDVCEASLTRRPRWPCSCGPWSVGGMYHWRLANVRVLDEPVLARGRLGLWDIDLDGRSP